jgi:hypothetical protein
MQDNPKSITFLGRKYSVIKRLKEDERVFLVKNGGKKYVLKETHGEIPFLCRSMPQVHGKYLHPEKDSNDIFLYQYIEGKHLSELGFISDGIFCPTSECSSTFTSAGKGLGAFTTRT